MNVAIITGVLIVTIVNFFIDKDELFFISFIPTTFATLFLCVLSFFVKEKSANSLSGASAMRKESPWKKKYRKCFILGFGLGLNQFAG